ncbi:chemotaxis protein CheA [Exiguobacterium sp. SH3S2]|uniref:chemotaxis protein CheA n=1 Tax=unclassified Exiguobacterium TaxID=2644629 RepID=UPI00103907AC|nr:MULTISPECIES: chemotaxis protein CheA [unclassified Exiguobacterium]TCI27418.1 chemotaxis protein CheA [Exiguobacterium sp. SH5S4]TCI49259.1 chemotaxis protein CheA [Exiguobacterium sp. SH3S3]TCI57949.1 chemotaxis protein CheA [Exiguobacterium sp. SH5S13]TCI64572.1 chemotaxis protein CheA [Exiguobacterium sp. SH3S2]TCI66101.1 chemotaxis protein CheA [Exiguobacterium sp. SH3S1]
MDVNEYLGLFLDESQEHIQSVNTQLMKFEQTASAEAVQEIFRSAHTLKGMSATMGYESVANLTHEMESALDLVRSGKKESNQLLLDTMFTAMEQIEAMIADIETGGTGTNVDVKATVSAFQSFIGSKEQTVAAAEESSVFTVDLYADSVIEQAKQTGFEAFQLHVKLSDAVVLKAARAYMVFDRLQELGEVVRTHPETEAIEQEQFDLSFDVLFLSQETAAVIEHAVSQVSEVETVHVSVFTGVSESESEPEIAVSAETVAVQEIKPKAQEAEEPKEQAVAQAKTIRVNLERIDRLMNLFEEFIIDRGRLERLADEVGQPELNETVEKIKRGTNELQSLVLTLRMMPIEQVFNRFPRMVRSVAKDIHKKVQLDISGADTELDRTVIDEIGDPLVHLIRNAIDHGIELPDKRVQAGKPQQGRLALRAYHGGNRVFIEIEDDGAGINVDKVRSKALERGVITTEEAAAMTDNELAMLIFAPGFSTADVVTDLSGRGVGLDVVKNKIESLGGVVTLETVVGQGTKFQVSLPLTLSIISAMLVQAGDETYAIPLSSILETTLLDEANILTAHRERVFDFRGQLVPLVYLKEIFGIDSETKSQFPVVVVRKGNKLVGVVVNDLIGQQEIVMKPLGTYLEGIPAISGATILGDGRVALIVDSNDLF